MYAVVTAGGRQYRVSPGDTIDVEKLTGAVGETVALTNVQLVGQGAEVTVGAPDVAGVRVEVRIVAQKRGKKIIIFKHRRRKGYRRKQGHRQSLTSLRVMGIYTAEDGSEPDSLLASAPDNADLGIDTAEHDITAEHGSEHHEPPPLSGEGIA
jgi:large subunit ribosomal protein L21